MRRVLKAPAAETLTIKAGSAAVKIIVDENRQDVEVTLDASGSKVKAANQATLINNELSVPRLEAIADGDFTIGYNRFAGVVIGGGVKIASFSGGCIVGGDIASRQLTLTVLIPHVLVAVDTEGDITVLGTLRSAYLRTSGGRIEVTKIEDTRLETDGGDISIHEASGWLSASTIGGHITASAVSGAVTLSSMGGSIYAEANDPRLLSADTRAGDVYVTGSYDRDNVRAQTAYGNVRYF